MRMQNPTLLITWGCPEVQIRSPSRPAKLWAPWLYLNVQFLVQRLVRISFWMDTGVPQKCQIISHLLFPPNHAKEREYGVRVKGKSMQGMQGVVFQIVKPLFSLQLASVLLWIEYPPHTQFQFIHWRPSPQHLRRTVFGNKTGAYISSYDEAILGWDGPLIQNDWCPLKGQMLTDN